MHSSRVDSVDLTQLWLQDGQVWCHVFYQCDCITKYEGPHVILSHLTCRELSFIASGVGLSCVCKCV